MTYLTPKQVAELLNVNRTTVYALCDKKLLEHNRFGVGRGTIRISQQQLDDFIRRTQVLPSDENAVVDYVYGKRNKSCKPN
jgi:excisionase family DNA binding protein